MPPQSALIKIVLSLVLTVVAFVINPWGLVSLAATVLSVLACIEWAKSKGLSPWWGAIGLLGFIGWIILFFVPAKVGAGLTSDANSNYPR